MATGGDMPRQAGHQALKDTPAAALEATETPTERQVNVATDMGQHSRDAGLAAEHACPRGGPPGAS